MRALLLTAALAAPAAAEIQVLSFNVAGIPLVHAQVGRRMRAIAAGLREGGYDLVALQEAWRDGDARVLARGSGLPHEARVPRRVSVGTGLSVLSRWPIVESEQRIFSCRPSKLRLLQGESVAHKGVLRARVQTPWGPLDVYNTHLISDYPKARYFTLRLTQLYELAEFVVERSSATPFVVLGDVNAGPESEEYRLLLDLLGLEDACRPGGRELCSGGRGRRIDHILLPGGRKPAAAAARLEFTDGAPGAYSDHPAVAARLNPELFSRRLSPDPERRAAALRRIGGAVDRMIRNMLERQRRHAWLPVWGFGMTLRYDLQLSQLAAVMHRAETARSLTLGSRARR